MHKSKGWFPNMGLNNSSNEAKRLESTILVKVEVSRLWDLYLFWTQIDLFDFYAKQFESEMLVLKSLRGPSSATERSWT